MDYKAREENKNFTKSSRKLLKILTKNQLKNKTNKNKTKQNN